MRRFRIVFALFLAAALVAAAARAQQPRGEAVRAMPTIHQPLPDVLSLRVPFEPENRRLAAMGYVDATAGPFLADPTGRRDSTRALQLAIDFARNRQMVCLLPSGTYLVSDTLRCVQPLYRRTNGAEITGRNHPCVVMGARGGKRPVIRLAPASPGFGDRDRPKPVVHFLATDFETPGRFSPGLCMNQQLVNVDVAIGAGNPGAVGVRLMGAQGSGIEECRVDAGDGFAGLAGACGGGGGFVSVEVEGGEYGLDLRAPGIPAPTVTGVRLRGQRTCAVIYSGSQALSLAGADIEHSGAGPAIVAEGQSWSPFYGQLVLTDSAIALRRPDGVAVRAESGLYMENVAISGAARAVESGGETVLPGAPGTLGIARLALGAHPGPWKGYAYDMPVYRDGRPLDGLLHEPADGPLPGPGRHWLPADAPWYGEAGAVDATRAPYRARGDGKADDTLALQRAIDEHDTVFLPKGIYRISRPLQLRPGTRLVGAARHLSLITPVPGAPAFADAARPSPLVRTADSARAATVLAFVGLHAPVDVPGATALEWRSGGGSLVRDVNVTMLPGLEGYGRTAIPAPRTGPQVLATGHGGGRWYGFYGVSWLGQAPGFRHFMVRDCEGPLDIYSLDAEHARSACNVEIASSRNIRVYGLKSEGNAPVLRVKDSTGVRVFGYGGIAAALPGGALFELDGARDTALAGLVDEPWLPGKGSDEFMAGRGSDPSAWAMVREAAPGAARATRPLERPMAYMTGGAP